MKFRSSILRIVKTAGLALLFIAVLEVCARLEDWIKWDAGFFANYNNEILRVADELGFHNRPGARYLKWRINEWGFRGNEIAKEKPPGVIRVVSTGASETFGLFESEGKDYPSQLQAILDEIEPGRFEVINAACPGMTPPRINYYFEHWLRQFEPDILIYFPGATAYLDIKPPPDEFHFNAARRWQPKKNLRIENKFHEAFKQFIPLSIQTWLRDLRVKRVVSQYPSGWIFDSVPEERVAIFHDQLTRLVEVVRRHDISIILSTYANLLSDCSGENLKSHIIEARRNSPRASEQALCQIESAANMVLKKLNGELGVPLADVAARLPRSTQYFADSVHFTDQGAAIVARTFADEILKVSAAVKSKKVSTQAGQSKK
ncbi:MAG: SGNH/GDSL hydrolase family protein [Desulfobacteraceae bacterium]|nr:MAG: SGNH/GDSL hydrolase family protein [Desulfobacteraceae bacterium]